MRNQLTSAAHYPSVPMTNAAQCTEPEYGISSAITELTSEVNAAVNVAAELRSSLGIDQPTEGCTAPMPNSLVGNLRSLISSLRDVNSDMNYCIRHIRS